MQKFNRSLKKAESYDNSSEKDDYIDPDDVERINLTPDNFEDYSPLVLVALSVAEPGAMGIEGDITMVSSDKKIYTLNYLYEDWDEDIISSVKDMLGHYYHEVDLGMGNGLYVSDSIWEDFSLSVDEDTLQRMHYRTWIAVTLNI